MYAATHLPLQLFFGSFEVLDEQILPRELVVVGEMVNALPVVKMHFVQLMVDPAGTDTLTVQQCKSAQLRR